MKNIIMFYVGAVNMAELEKKLQQRLNLRYFSHIDLIWEEYELKSELGIKTYKYIKEQYLPETDVIFELLESYFMRPNDLPGMLFSPFFEKQNWVKLLKLHKVCQHQLCIIHFHETVEQHYKKSLEDLNPYAHQIPNYEEKLWQRAQEHNQVIQERITLTSKYPDKLILDAYLPLEEQYKHIVALYEAK
ncbi:hypothetical protein [uncultured Microscilla sp.]|uniref:hypothetical protein n=1 Tax=uncultured Microscilla sp. TaxID=432653 RepID=UPI0026033C9C|nr:hypothetical protein [uncultured Microscilla sp.]